MGIKVTCRSANISLNPIRLRFMLRGLCLGHVIYGSSFFINYPPTQMRVGLYFA